MNRSWRPLYCHWPIRVKIGVGYTLALGIAMGGTAIGFLVGQFYERQATENLALARAEALYLRELQANALALPMHEQILLNSIGTPQEFLRQRDQLDQKIDIAATAFERLSTTEGIAAESELGILLSKHENTIRVYDRELQSLLATLPIYSSTQVEREEAKEDFFEFIDNTAARRLYVLVQNLEPLIIEASGKYNLAQSQAQQANRLRSQIVVLSFILSSILGSALVTYMNHLISDPLKRLTQVSREIARDRNFNRSLQVETQDEVGLLADAFNQLIQEVNQLLTVQRQQQEAQLMQHEKMASLGRMLAGVAHEINNPVNFIYGNLGHAENYLNDLISVISDWQTNPDLDQTIITDRLEDIDYDFLKADLPKLVHSMRFGSERARQIVMSLKNFSRLDESVPHSIEIDRLIDSTLLILNNRLKQTIQVRKEYQEIPEIEGYSGSLYQVFMNILSNAIEALDEAPDVEDKTIWIRLNHLDPNHITIAIADNGPGIPADVRDRIFERFFTTKAVNVGTGLGLAISWQIVVEKHHGTLVCQSTVGQGTEFLITLPIQFAPPAAVPTPELVSAAH